MSVTVPPMDHLRRSEQVEGKALEMIAREDQGRWRVPSGSVEDSRDSCLVISIGAVWSRSIRTVDQLGH